MAGIEVGYDGLSAGENFGMLQRGLSDGKLAMGAASMEGEVDLLSILVPVETIFHFVAVEIFLAVGGNWGWGDL